MMASTLAANLSTMPPASGREREHKIAPMASRRRYVCEPLHLEAIERAFGIVADVAPLIGWALSSADAPGHRLDGRS